MTLPSLPVVLGAAALATQLVACNRQAASHEAPLRMVKLVAPGTAVTGDYRFVAVVRQAQRADLSFESSGRLASITVDVGDTVKRGQVLATIDAEPARLQLVQAEAQVRSTAGQLQERRDQLRQQQAMHADGASSALTLDAAQVALTVAEAAHSTAAAALQLAARAQRLSVLRAPYDGRIKARLAEPGALAGAGQAVLQIEGGGHTQVVADLPAGLIPPSLKPGATVTASVTDVQPTVATIKLTLRSLADHIDGGGTLQAIFDLQPGQAPRRSGEALSITIASGSPPALTLPLAAVAQGAVAGTGHVFVYHRSGNVLERRPVVLGRQRGDTIEIAQGLHAAEQVAGAGTAFLIDHQRVLPYQAESRLAAGEKP
ncbi:MAG: efflux RND transporter periplasmic adaptor subunit [Duganella sp.]